MKIYYITATGTDIGKTYLTTLLNTSLIKRHNKKSFTLKPLISGFDKSYLNNDTSLIINSMGMDYNDINIDKISPFRLKLPLSPDIAADKEGIEIKYEEILDFCIESISQQRSKKYDYLFIEGVGGVMSPICKNKTNLDLIADLDISVILVVGSYLGSISHTLTAINAIETNNINIFSVVICESSKSNINIEETAKSISGFVDYNLISLLKMATYKDTDIDEIIL